MPYISSPVAYPPSSSPPQSPTKKRRRSFGSTRRVLKPVDSNGVLDKQTSMFQEVSDEENDPPSNDDSGVEVPPIKRARQILPECQETSREQTRISAASCTHTSDSAGLSLGSSILGPSLTALSVPAQGNVEDPIQDNELTGIRMATTRGRDMNLRKRTKRNAVSYEQIVAARSEVVAGKAQRSHYGIDINRLMADAKSELEAQVEVQSAALESSALDDDNGTAVGRRAGSLMWTEKYRARKFTDLVGDDRTHRNVMHWLKAWDQIVFPGMSRRPQSQKKRHHQQNDAEAKVHRKILLLTGPPGLGKTTLAHVCAKQAGYEVAEINGSDDRSRDTVKGKIRDILGTENVKAAQGMSGTTMIAKPVCLIVDEVDGVTSGSSGGGEGGFVKALMDLLLLDQRNQRDTEQTNQNQASSGRKRKGDSFRMLRPLIMICNDVYHQALRPLRSSPLVEVLHVGKPALGNVATRVQGIFARERVAADGDAIRKLCEGCWGSTSKKEGGSGTGSGDGDIRSVLVLAEWIARRLQAQAATYSGEAPRLSKKWLETHFAESGQGQNFKGLGRGGTREIVDRVFMENAGISRATNSSTMTTFAPPGEGIGTKKTAKSVNEGLKAASSAHLRTLIDGHGESDRVMTDLFTQYPSQPFQDDTFLTKPCQAYEWLEFHDRVSSAVFSSSEWELAPYLSTPVIGFHHLFATSSATQARHTAMSAANHQTTTSEAELHPFSGLSASFAAHERQKQHTSTLQSLHDSLSLPLTRLFPRPESMSTELIPHLLRCLAPAVNPVLITSSTGPSASGASKFENNKTTASVRKASEKVLVDRGVNAMLATGCRFERHRIESGFAPQGAGAKAAGGFVYRMTPALDEYGMFETLGKGMANDVAGVSAAGGRYGVRQVLVQECAAAVRKREAEARARRRRGRGEDEQGEEVDLGAEGEKDREGVKMKGVKRDFFGRVVQGNEGQKGGGEEKHAEGSGVPKAGKVSAEGHERIWVTFHEGYSNAVRKPVTLAELMRDL